MWSTWDMRKHINLTGMERWRDVQYTTSQCQGTVVGRVEQIIRLLQNLQIARGQSHMTIATMVHHFAHGDKVEENSSPHPKQLKGKWTGLSD